MIFGRRCGSVNVGRKALVDNDGMPSSLQSEALPYKFGLKGRGRPHMRLPRPMFVNAVTDGKSIIS